MKYIFTLAILSIASSFATAQNVGIGTSTPLSTLHVAAGGLGTSFTIENLSTSPGSSTYNTINFRHRGTQAAQIAVFDHPDGTAYFDLNLKGDSKLRIQSNGNVGIGTINPTHRLEVNGTMRIADNLGVGVSTPTARLDLLGTFRYRGSGYPNLPEPGAVLTSVDDDGNAQWQRPVVFKVAGLKEDLSANAYWKKVYFSTTSEYNTGFYYNNVQSVFNPPVTGVYHFDVQLLWKGTTAYSGLKLVLLRNGSYITAGFTRTSSMIAPGTDYDITYPQTIQLSTDVRLQPGDQLWVEVHGSGTIGALLQTEATHSWFSGHLVSRVP